MKDQKSTFDRFTHLAIEDPSKASQIKGGIVITDDVAT